MRKTNKIISLLLAIATVCSVAAGCKKKDGDSSVTPEQLKTWSEKPTFEDSAHDLVKDGKSEYVIVYPENASTQVKTGVQELQLFFKEATGIDLNAYTDASYANAASAKMISVGETKPFQALNIDLDGYDLGASGYIVKTVDDDVYLVSDGKYGSMYACYEFLSYQFNYEYFAADEIRLETNVKNKKLKNFNLVDIPSFEYRMSGNGTEAGEVVQRNRMHYFTDVYAGSWDSGEAPPIHNYFELIDKGKYGDHAEWFSPDGSQLCLSRDFDGLLDAVFYEVTELLNRFPTHEIVTFTQEDGPTWCTHCIEEYERLSGEAGSGDNNGMGNVFLPGMDGDDSASGAKEYYTLQNIRFVNALAKKIKEWNQETCPERTINVYLFRYGMTSSIPVKKDSNGNPILDADGNYIFFDESLELSDNLGVLYCYNFQTTYNEQQHSTYYTIQTDLKKWQSISNHFALWGYTTNFQNYFAPFDAIQQLEANVELCKESKAQVFYIMSQYNTTTPVDWGNLETYVTQKLAWNSDLDVAQLTNEWFDNYFKQASGIMKEIYNDYTTQLAWISSENKVNGIVNGQVSMLTQKNWPYRKLIEFLDKFDEAYATIKPLEMSDPTLYKKLYDRINIESMTFRYMLYKLHADRFDYNQLTKLREEVVAECRALGIEYAHEHGSIDGLFDI